MKGFFTLEGIGVGADSPQIHEVLKLSKQLTIEYVYVHARAGMPKNLNRGNGVRNK